MLHDTSNRILLARSKGMKASLCVSCTVNVGDGEDEKPPGWHSILLDMESLIYETAGSAS